MLKTGERRVGRTRLAHATHQRSRFAGESTVTGVDGEIGIGPEEDGFVLVFYRVTFENVGYLVGRPGRAIEVSCTQGAGAVQFQG